MIKEAFAFAQVVRILAGNVFTYGRPATQITQSHKMGQHGLLALFFGDNLEITDIIISRTGEPGRGARFPIHVPKGGYEIGRIARTRCYGNATVISGFLTGPPYVHAWIRDFFCTDLSSSCWCAGVRAPSR